MGTKKTKVKNSTKADILLGIKEAIQELKQIRTGRLKEMPAKELINEL